MTRLLVLAWGAAELEVPDWAEPPRDLAGLERAEEVARLAATRTVLWLPAGAALGRSEWEEVGRWLAAGPAKRPRVAEVRTRLRGEGFDLAGGAALLLSTPGAVALRAGRVLRAGGAAVERLAFVLPVRLPPSISQHLDELNRRTSTAARLLAGAADRASSARLLAPWLPALARSLSGRGPWRARLARAVLDAYGRVLVEAKVYERGLPPAGPPPGEAR